MSMVRFSNLKSIDNLFKHDMQASIMPAYYIIEPTNFCNYICHMCPNKSYTNSEKGHMEWQLFTKIIDEIKDYALIIQLYWMGEPFLHKDLFNMIDYISSSCNAKIILSTNGSLLNNQIIERILDSQIYKIIISLDAAKSQAIYSKIRVGGDVDTVNRNVLSILEKKPSIKFDLQFIDFNINKSEKDEFEKMWADKQCRLVFSWLNTWANQFEHLKDETYYYSPHYQEKRLPCSDLWYKMSIHWNGHVSTCCYDWKFNTVLGNVQNDNIRNIWNSELITRYRSAHKEFFFSKVPLCGNCDEWATPSEYMEIQL